MTWIINNKEWIFSGFGVVLLGFIFKRIRYKITCINRNAKLPNNKNYSIIIDKNTNTFKNMAGRDIIINQNSLSDSIDDLISILDIRANLIIKDLSSHFNHATTTKYLNEFIDLHKKHIKALKGGNLILAHEILIQIYNLSQRLEDDEFSNYKIRYKRSKLSFWQRCSQKLSTILWSKSEPYISKSGILIDAYIAGDMIRYSLLCKNFNLHEDNNMKAVLNIYNKIFKIVQNN